MVYTDLAHNKHGTLRPNNHTEVVAMSNLIPRHHSEPARTARNFFGDDFFNPFFFGGDLRSMAFSIDVREIGNEYILEAELPGLKREDIHVDIDDGILSISAEWKNGRENGEGENYIINERRAGRVQRTFTLENVVEDQITADYNDGVLTVKLPKREQSQRAPRRIELN